MKLYQSHGQVYAYYRRGGLSFRIEGDVGTKAWFDRYEELHRQYEASRGRSEPAPGSVDAFIVDYRKSARYRVLADSTKERYGYALAKLSKAIGAFPLANITRRAVVRLQDKIAETQPRNAIEVTKVLYLVFECACDLGEVDVNPAKDVKKPATYKANQHEAWTDDQISQFLAASKPVWRRAVTVALFTGLRRGDLIRLSRSNIRNGWINTNISKTDGDTSIPIHPELQAELDRPMPASSLMLIPTARGRQMNKDSLSHGIKKECERLGIVPNPPLHGLRRSAIIRLLEAGCTEEEVTSITDQSRRMVQYYAGRRHKRRLAEVVKIKMERKSDKSV